MTVGIICEKPSAARHMAQALGGTSGCYQGTDYVIVALRGHVYQLRDPSDMVSAADREHYKRWTLSTLPWDYRVFSWALQPSTAGGISQVISQAVKALQSVDEIAIATDFDPGGEGGMIAANFLLENNLTSKKLTRMYFTDEEEGSLRDAFTSRVALSSIHDFDEYKRAKARARWDLLSVQFTRVATLLAGQDVMLRQGRLKSAIVVLVGDALRAYNSWTKVPYFQNRFKDENGVVYTNPNEPQVKNKVDVVQRYTASNVVVDSRNIQRTKPPRLLNLAGLSGILSAKGISAKQVLTTYQAMYEAQVVSYPRTEDKFVTPEQFNELLPRIDQIASVVGADASLLTHRQPRSSHVKTGGAHGANRPGRVVPDSLSELDKKFGPGAAAIYEVLAKNYLRMFAEDYVYERQVGHVAAYPEFVGSVNVPKSLGWKAVFSDGSDDDDDASEKGLGRFAEPFIHEGYPARPPHPTQKWLMTQLEKYSVGTGATQTSTYADMLESRGRILAMLNQDSRGKITLPDAGWMSYWMLQDTAIGDLGFTERLFADLKEVGVGSKSEDQVLATVADMIRNDLEVMKRNAPRMWAEVGVTAKSSVAVDRAEGTWNGKKVSFKRVWGGHTFTDEEVADLLAGKTITITGLVSEKTGRQYGVTGKLSEQKYKGVKYVGFEKLGFVNAQTVAGSGSTAVASASSSGVIEQRPIPEAFFGHTFTESEKKKLLDGAVLHLTDLWSTKKKKTFAAYVSWRKKPENQYFELVMEFGK